PTARSRRESTGSRVLSAVRMLRRSARRVADRELGLADELDERAQTGIVVAIDTQEHIDVMAAGREVDATGPRLRLRRREHADHDAEPAHDLVAHRRRGREVLVPLAVDPEPYAAGVDRDELRALAL